LKKKNKGGEKMDIGTKIWDMFWTAMLKKTIDAPFDFLRTVVLIVLLESVAFLSYPILVRSSLHMLVGTGLFLLLAVVLALACKVVFRGSTDSSDSEIEDLESKLSEMEKEKDATIKNLLKQNTEQSKAISQTNLKMDALMKRGVSIIEAEKELLVSLLKMKLNEVIPVNHLIENSEIKSWDNEWEKDHQIAKNSYRILGAVRVSKDVHLGIKLDDVMLCKNEEKKEISYSLPQIILTSECSKEEKEWALTTIMCPVFSIIDKSQQMVVDNARKIKDLFRKTEREPDKMGLEGCEWRLVKGSDKRPPEIENVFMKIEKEIMSLYHSSETLKDAKKYVEDTISKKIVERQIALAGYTPKKVDSFLPEDKIVSFLDFTKSSMAGLLN
jgi:hypothetical protein